MMKEVDSDFEAAAEEAVNEEVLADDFGEEDVSQGDFDGENTLARQVQSAIEKTPPITQAFLTLSIGATVLAMLLNNNRFPDFLLLDWAQVASRGQLWRLFTAFLYFGPLDISFALTVQFVWQYMSQLEKVHHKEPEQVSPQPPGVNVGLTHVFEHFIKAWDANECFAPPFLTCLSRRVSPRARSSW